MRYPSFLGEEDDTPASNHGSAPVAAATTPQLPPLPRGSILLDPNAPERVNVG